VSARLSEAFATATDASRAALVGYLTAYDPDREGSLERVVAACEAGLDVLELGVPFSDPNADGPDVQGAMVRALRAGATTRGVLELAARVRERVATPIVLFTYANPLLRLGAEAPSLLADAGVDAVLVLDVPMEESAPLRDPLRARGIHWVGLVAPTTPPERLRDIARAASGFVYLVSLKGVTGAALDADDTALRASVAALRAATDLPIAVGFGVRTGDDVARMSALADGVVVGSALVRAAQQGASTLADLVRQLALRTRRAST
jgi:tryptophan synthase alpha chain